MDLTGLRKKIDSLDVRIVALLNERAAVTLAVGKEKIRNNRSIYAPDREQEVLKRVKNMNKGPISS
ncbi:MAG: chorismate mutase, partial [Candidatus Omnitrophica bacterium]|nr:chorismate mutase [Candidatus Omnitrophota bacterium]